MRCNEHLRPSIFSASFVFPEPEDWGRRGVMNGGSQSAGMRMSNARERWMNRPDSEGKSKLFEREHLRVAKSLRENGIPRIEISEPHFEISDFGKIAEGDYLFLSGIRYPKS